MFVLFAQVFVFYYGMFCDCLTSRQIFLSLKIKKLLYVMQTFEDTIYQFVACKNRVLFLHSILITRKKCIELPAANIFIFSSLSNFGYSFITYKYRSLRILVMLCYCFVKAANFKFLPRAENRREYTILKIKMLCNLCCLKVRLRLLCNKLSMAQRP